MRVRKLGIRRFNHRVWRFGGTSTHEEAVLHHRDAKAGLGAVLGRVGSMQEVGEEETDELKRHADHAVPKEGEERADGKTVNVYFVRGSPGCKNCGFPIWRGCIGGSLLIRLELYQLA